MAAETVDHALGVLGERASERPSKTANHRLVGAADRPELDRLAVEVARSASLAPSVASRLVARHGLEAGSVVELGKRAGLLAVLPGTDHLEAEVAWAARSELALSLDDVLARRMRVAQELPDRGASIAPRVAAIMAGELGWDAGRQTHEVETYLAGAKREFAVP
jgi:glycerol-3-phosphate dehydrogenase